MNTIFIFILVATLLLFLRYRNLYLLLIPLIFFGITISFTYPVYSVIDEAAHFEYILRILYAKRLPTLHENDIWLFQLLEQNSSFHAKLIPAHANYGAVQPPFYYLVVALLLSPIYLIFKDPTLIFHGARLLGVVLLAATVITVIKTYYLLVGRKIIPRFDLLFFSLLTISFFSERMLQILIPVSNEHMAVFFFSLGLYLLTRISSEPFSRKIFIIFTTLSVLIFYTRFTAISFFPISALVLWLRYGFKKALVYSITVALFALPFFIYNFVHYHDLTGARKHIDFVLPIVNPNNESYDVMRSMTFVLETFRKGIFLQSVHNNLARNLGLFIPSLLFLAFCTLWVVALKKRFLILGAFWAAIFGSCVFLTYSTISTRIPSIIDRYFFLNITPMLILMYYFILTFFRKKGVYLLSGIFILYWFIAAWEYLLIPYLTYFKIF
ncbi:MAG: hypothetical protein N2691_02020 [Patescibacteria group bacterium]|nr:hypothetical protein [Patescibacteria group bacterium]